MLRVITAAALAMTMASSGYATETNLHEMSDEDLIEYEFNANYHCRGGCPETWCPLREQASDILGRRGYCGFGYDRKLCKQAYADEQMKLPLFKGSGSSSLESGFSFDGITAAFSKQLYIWGLDISPDEVSYPYTSRVGFTCRRGREASMLIALDAPVPDTDDGLVIVTSRESAEWKDRSYIYITSEPNHLGVGIQFDVGQEVGDFVEAFYDGVDLMFDFTSQSGRHFIIELDFEASPQDRRNLGSVLQTCGLLF